MPWLVSKNNSFAHEDPATINALMSASVEGKSPTTAPQTVFAHRHLDLLLAVPLRNHPPTLRSFWSLMPQIAGGDFRAPRRRTTVSLHYPNVRPRPSA